MSASRVVLAAPLVLVGACSCAPTPAELARSLRSQDVAERERAVAELSALGPELRPVITEVEKAVLDANVGVRTAAVQVLATQPGEGLAGLLVALDDDDPGVRAAAATALGGAGEKAIAGLVAHLGDSDHRVAAAAEAALVRIGAPARPALARAAVTEDADTRDRAMRALVELDGDEGVGEAAARALESPGLSVGDGSGAREP